MNKQTRIIAIVLSLLLNINICKAYTNGTLWPGKTIRLEVNTSMGYLNPTWSVTNPTVTLSGSGFYRDVKASAYFGGTCIITCSYEYYVGSTKYNNKTTWEYDCANNTFTLTPTKMNIGVGKTQAIGWSFGWATYMTPTMQFTGYDTSIINVSSSGVVTAKSEGTTTVYVSSNLGTNTASCVVNVSNAFVTPITVSIPSRISIEKGDNYQFLPNVTSDDDNYSITWKSEDETIASVDSNGKLTGVNAGMTTVTASINNGEAEAYCAVEVKNCDFELKANPAGCIIEKGTTVELTTGLKDAVIYYTIDGSYPMDNPTLYKEPICVETPLLINALAYHKDYGTSELMTESYEVTTLKVTSVLPSENDVDVKKSVTPTITFNEEIQEDETSLITMRNSKTGQAVEFECVTNGTELIIVPNEDLETDMYEISIPAHAVMNKSGEPNSDITYNFRVTSGEQYARLDRYFRLMDNGSLYVWGYTFPNMSGFYNQDIEEYLALDNVKDIFMPWNINAINVPTQYYYIDMESKLWGWGTNSLNNYSNPIGDGSENNITQPTIILSNVKDFRSNTYHKAALSNTGRLYLWGNCNYGQIGDGYLSINGSLTRTSPVGVLSDVKVFDLGQFHSIAVTNTGKLWAWGFSKAIGKSSNCTEPTLIDSNVTYACTGDRHNLYIKDDNTLWSFGENYPCLGSAPSSSVTYVAPTKILSDVEKCYAGMFESLALKTNGDLYQWGYAAANTGYLLGNTPMLVLQGVKDVQVEGTTVYVLKKDGTVWTRGTNSNGQLGLGHTYATSEYYKEFHTPDIDNVERIWAYTYGCYAMKTDGSLWGWGEGLPYIGKSYIPVELRPGNKALEGIVITESDIRMKPGEKLLLHISPNPSSATYASIEWTSSNEDVVKVSSRGIVQGTGNGEAVVTAIVKTDAGFAFKATCNVIVAETTGINHVKPYSLKAWSKDGMLHINGLSTGETVYIYSTAGILLDEIQAKHERASIAFVHKGICIIKTNKGKQIKVAVSD